MNSLFFQVGTFFLFCTFLVIFITSLNAELLLSLLFLGVAVSCLIVLSKSSSK
jgi:hypothetical protein